MSYETDIIVRQQIYLEGVKNYEADQGEEVRNAVIAVVVALLIREGIERLSDMNKRQFSQFVSLVRARLAKRFTQLNVATVKRFIELMRADYLVTKNTYKAMFPDKGTPPKVAASVLWADIRNDPIAATGDKPVEMSKGFYAAALAAVTQLLKQSYADRKTVQETILLLQGTKKLKFKDGLLSKLVRQYGAMIETVIQHISGYIGAKLGSFFSDRYIWLSVLDANTTDICRGRNGHIYLYGAGPQPPAHFRCRSRTRPVFAEVGVPVSFYQWFMRQPPIFQDDIFGQRTAGGYRSGRYGAADMPKYTNDLRLTPQEYAGKQNLITTA